jgi:nucleoid DNA-binding protein
MKEKTIIQKLATKYNLPLTKVEDMVYHQFKYAAKIMKLSDFETIRLPYFGKFHAKKSRIAHINELKRRKNERLANGK